MLGDVPALPSLKPTARIQATRPDHVLSNNAALPYVKRIAVNVLQNGSDHLPLEVCLELPVPVVPAVQCQGHQIPAF